MNVMRVQDAMTPSVVTLRPTDTIHEAAGLFADAAISGAPVTKGGVVVGMLSETDILRVVLPATLGRPHSLFELLTGRQHVVVHVGSGPLVGDVMTKNVVTIRPTATLWDAAEQMQRANINRLPVVDDAGRLVGLISRADVVRMLGRSDAAILAEVTAGIDTVARETGSHPLPQIDVSVEDGFVTIRGEATAPWAKRIVAQVAALTPGAFGVKNETVVHTV
ncbi:MAG: CBS domain-containing protein [Actinomycetota bacterium]